MAKQKTNTPKAAPDVKAPGLPEVSRFSTLFTDDIARRAINKQLDDDEKDAVIRLYERVLHSPMPKTCSNCISDAFFELYNIWKRDTAHFDDLYNCEYRLRGGVLLQIFGDNSKNAVNKTLTNELAELHLKLFPEKAKLFERLPDDWRERIK